MKVLCFLLIWGVIFNTDFVLGAMDFTYSPADLYRLVQTEEKIFKSLQQIKEHIESFKSEIERFQSRSLLEHSAEEILRNPLLSYHLVKRHGRDLIDFDKEYEAFNSTMTDWQSSYKKLRTTFMTVQPSTRDVEQGMEAIVRMRQTYNLSVENLAKGQIGPLQIEGSLEPQDLADIGHFATGTGMTANAQMFLTEAIKQCQGLSSTDACNMKDDWVQNARLKLAKLHQKSISEQRSDREDFRLLTEIDEYFATDTIENLNVAFENLCQIHQVKEPPVSHLKCYLDKRSNIIHHLSPLKIEVFHETPQIVVIYDFMSNSELDAIEAATFYNLKRSRIQFVRNGSLDSEPSIIRTTSQTWLHDFGHPDFGYLSKRIEAATGYFMSGINSAEDLQVASYRPGGHYSLHTDALYEEMLEEFFTEEDLIKGDRQATFMLYLTDVEMGGNTAFPALNVSVKPIKGSAILWGNLYPDGNINRHTLHGACPVVYGIKNIATKWIRANDQMFTRHRCKKDKTSDHFEFL